MVNLKNYIIESIFDIEDNIDNVDESIKDQIRQFLNDNFKNASKFKISKKPNKDSKFEVLSNGSVEIKNRSINSLTNGLFIWTNIKGNFICPDCSLIVSLKGSPEKVEGTFSCMSCNSLTSLEGAPKEVGGDFYCNYCNSLTSLKGSPEEIKGNFYCNKCNSLISLEGAPEKVGGDFRCEKCKSLTSLEGAPKVVGEDFSCSGCGLVFTTNDVKKVSKVGGNIYV